MLWERTQPLPKPSSYDLIGKPVSLQPLPITTITWCCPLVVEACVSQGESIPVRCLSKVGIAFWITSATHNILGAVSATQHTLHGLPGNISSIYKEEPPSYLKTHLVIFILAGYYGDQVPAFQHHSVKISVRILILLFRLNLLLNFTGILDLCSKS